MAETTTINLSNVVKTDPLLELNASITDQIQMTL